jgi:hypothetical protein
MCPVIPATGKGLPGMTRKRPHTYPTSALSLINLNL